MEDFIITIMLYVIYYYFRIINFTLSRIYVKMLYIIFAFQGIISVFQNKYENMAIMVFALMMLYLVNIKIVKHDIERKELFSLIMESKIHFLLVNGFTNIEFEKIENAKMMLNKYIVSIENISKKNFGFIAYDDGKIKINLLFWRKKEAEYFLQNCTSRDMIVEPIKNGCAITIEERI